MTDHPIIFSAPMVLALLAGRKTMTRRLAWTGGPKAARDGTITIRGSFAPRPSPWQRVKPGDRLWVREAWSYYGGDEMLYQRLPGAVGFRADVDTDPRLRDGRIPGGYWRPSIHLPRWASRLTLVVTAARVERLQAISETDAQAEGLWSRPAHFDPRLVLWHWEPEGGRVLRAAGWESPRGAFCNLWERLHGCESWYANPEVVALTFAVHRCNIDAMDGAA